MIKALRHCVLILQILLLSGCATYGAGLNGAITDLRKGDFQASEKKITQELSPTGSDRLLYHLELGMLRHLEGRYQESNVLLEKAERIADDLETRRITNELAVMMTNPRMGNYAGAEFERVFINFYKSLNYLELAGQSATRNEQLDNLEASRVEARRLIIKLNDISDRKGNYKQKKDKDEETFTKLLSVFSKLMGNLVNNDDWQYRDDAMAHYLAGLSFEMNREYDNARISYQKAAEAYEGGYTKQYFLDDDTIQQAWFDTIRMMRDGGGYENEWPELAQKKLNKHWQNELEKWQRRQTQLVVIEDKGLAPQRKEMNLELSVNPGLRSLQLRPYLVGNDRDELAWFYVLYADKNLTQLVSGYLNITRSTYQPVFFTKTVPLGPLWYQAERLGLTEAIGNSLRVTVPYYGRLQQQGPSTLHVDHQSLPMIRASSPAMIAVQEQLVNAGADIRSALARAAFKALTALTTAKVADKENAGLYAFAGKLLMQLTDAAETRNWLLLPNDIRIRRVPVAPGEHQLELESALLKAGQKVHREAVTLEDGDIHLWRVRTLDGAPAK